MRYLLILFLFSHSFYSHAKLNISESLVEGGEFYVGSVFGEHDYQSHANIKLNSYYMMRTEITYQFYNEILIWAREHSYSFNEGCNGAVYDDCRPPESEEGSHPITNIEWSDTITFANALSEKIGLSPVYITEQHLPIRDSSQYDFIVDNNANGYRLPTINEWMVAARGGYSGLKNRTYGNYYSGSNSAQEVAWFPPANSDQFGTSPVQKLKANALGIFDMSGNVYEWVFDSDTSLGTKMYYFCGGSYLQPTILSSCDVHSANFVMPDIGFRLIRSAK